MHATREDGCRAQAAEALNALHAAGDKKRLTSQPYESAVAHGQAVERYVRQAAAAPGRTGAYTWVDPGERGGAPYATNFAGDQMLTASAAARGLVQHARRHLDRGDFNQAHALARRAQSLAEAAQSALAPGRRVFGAFAAAAGGRRAPWRRRRWPPPVWPIWPWSPSRPRHLQRPGHARRAGTRLDALMRLACWRRRIAGRGRAGRPVPGHGVGAGAGRLANQFVGGGGRAAVAAAMARAHDGDGAVGHRVYCLKQASTMSDWMLGGSRAGGDRRLCQHALDAAWMRNGLRLEPEVPPPCLKGAGAAATPLLPRPESTAPAWAQ